MPRPKTAIRYQERIATLAEEGYRAAPIFRMVKEEAEKKGRDDYPSERTVRRIFEEHKDKPPDERRQHALFRWPDAMMLGDLPWEATRPMLDLLAFMDSVGDGRPTVQQATWYWRVYLADPSQDPLCILVNAALLLELDRTYYSGKMQRDDYTEEVEYRLAYKNYGDNKREG